MRELVTDAEDPRLADYARLTDMELRTSLESGQGLFIAEGTKVIGRAVAAGYPVRSMMVAERRLGDLPALPATGGPVYVVPDETAERLTGYRVHRGALASLHRKPLPETATLAAVARRVIVLEDLVDHANVGAIFRCAAALGAAVTGQRTALLLGTEGDGLSSRWLNEADQAVRIPMHAGALAAGVDSLNVVAAAAIACHVLMGADPGPSALAILVLQATVGDAPRPEGGRGLLSRQARASLMSSPGKLASVR
jgi:tRNA G18 (ribose-2'-O)-methylase SpoU